ncbi:tetratricopeptide repeat protein, partial [Lactobacillus crispatus]|uniref:tetratricopeptide repeat protein n=1 Tax=Lactobacillus crispatus TaxID=47770 RepID=UPI001414EDAC
MAERNLESIPPGRVDRQRDRAVALNLVAQLHRKLGHYAKAVAMQRTALAIFKKVSRTADVDVVEGLNNLAGLYRTQAEYSLAERTAKQALTINGRRSLPEQFAEVKSLVLLANVRFDRARYA